VARTALITGSAGARGDALSVELTRRGWTVRVARDAEGVLPPLDPCAAGAEAIFHVGVRTPRLMEAERRAALEERAAAAAGTAARRAGVNRFVLLSTASVYGRPRNLPCEEGELKRPRTAAERARWRAEQAAWRTFRDGTPLSVLRPTIVYGPGLRGGAIRALSLIALVSQGARRIPIIRRGPVTHLVHVEDVARAAVHLAEHPEGRDVIGRAFNVGDDAPLPLAEHLSAALAAMGYRPGRVLPYSPRVTAFLLWCIRHLPDRVLSERINGRLASAWASLMGANGSSALAPRIDREALQWMSCDHYYDVGRLAALGWRPLHPISTTALPATVQSLIQSQLLPARPTSVLSRLLPGG
jgi:nucleoside-diphosphate-sugar epimerase